jgi:hypothetical protein
MNPYRYLQALTRGLCAVAISLGAIPFAFAVDATVFPTPNAAVDALREAAKSTDDAPLVALLGDAHRAQLVQQDRAAALADRARFAEAIAEYRVLREEPSGRLTVLVGFDAWPFPIPLASVAGGWQFATGEGVQEIIDRRIGRNEVSAIDVLREYVDAQFFYASEDRMGDGVRQYARRIASSTNKRDGLFWPADGSDESESPFSSLARYAAPYLKGHKPGDAYRGYHYRILTGQGGNAAGGAYSYVINGRMVAGFAMVAYPAQYGVSGIMTFMVNHNGKLFQKDLGAETPERGAKVRVFDAGPGWTLVRDDY